MWIEEWRSIKNGGGDTNNKGFITYNDWKYDSNKRELANNEFKKTLIYKFLFEEERQNENQSPPNDEDKKKNR